MSNNVFLDITSFTPPHRRSYPSNSSVAARHQSHTEMTDQCPSWDTGTHSLYSLVSGPTISVRKGSLKPAVIIELGLCSGLAEWVAVQRLIARKACVYSCDRVACGRSESSPQNATAQDRIKDLSRLLEATAIKPSYVLIGHSYGGVHNQIPCANMGTRNGLGKSIWAAEPELGERHDRARSSYRGNVRVGGFLEV